MNKQLQEDLFSWQLTGMELHEFMDELRAQGPVSKVKFQGMTAYLVSSHDALERAFENTQDFPPERAYQIGITPLVGEIFSL